MAELLALAGNAQREPEAPVPLIDLRDIDSSRRAVMWHGAATTAFPGLKLKLAAGVPLLGTINRYRMGAGELIAIESAPVEVSYPPKREGAPSPYISLMVQLRGSTRISQFGRHCDLGEGDICLVDEASGFRLACEEASGILFLRLPQGAALSRHPQIERLYAQVMPGAEPGTRMLADTLLRLHEDAADLSELQRAAILSAVLQMLGVAGPFAAPPDSASWRICRALDFIELNLSVAGLTAEHVAQDQYISRRRLDQLLQDATGKSIAGHLWDRRLARAAADLRDAHRSSMTVGQIAFANGFEDAAHFSRAFKRRYALTPGQWRLN